METQKHYRQRLANGPASSPTVRVASRSQRHFSAEPSTPDHSHPSKSVSQRRNTKDAPANIYTDSSRVSASPSSTHYDTPQRNIDSARSTPLVNPTSSLLQGLINEQRANRGGRRGVSEHPSDIQVQTPTITPSQDDSSSEKQRKVTNVLSAGLKEPREMGIREMNQYVSKLNKLNFDLKLEIYHRSQQLISLEKKLERMEALEEEVQRLQGVEEELQELREVEESNQSLRESNEHLRLELDKRDQAVNEAVELICRLEARLDELEATNDDGDDERPLTARPHTSEGLAPSPSMTPKGTPIFEIPDRTSSWKGTSSARSLRTRTETTCSSTRRPRKHPSFLLENSGSTSALRSLYIAADEETTSGNGFSTSSLTESFVSGDEPPEPGSPRLSILSECSYLDPSATPSKRFDDVDVTSVGSIQRSFSQPISKLELSSKQKEEKDVKMSRIDQWIQPHDDPQTPTGQRRDNFPVETSETVPKKPQPSLGTAFQAKHPVKPYRFDTPRLDGPLFNGGRLPPTPDTMSTSNPDARNRSNSSIIVEKSLLDQGRPFANFSGGHIALRRPRSADDITTRPSTGSTALSGMIETLSNATRLGINPSRDHLGSIFPTFGDHVAGGSKRTELLLRGDLARQDCEDYAGENTNPNISATTPNNGEDSTLSARRKRYPPSLTSTHSEPRYEASISSSPPLTPQDWLEAALPADGGKRHRPVKFHHQRSHQHKKSHSTDIKHTSLLSTGEPATPTSTIGTTRSEKIKAVSKPDDLHSPSPTSLRSRIKGSRNNNNPPQTEDVELPRHRLSLRPRFFSRAVTAAAAAPQRQTAPMSDPVDDGDSAPSPKIGRSGRMSTSRRKSVHVELAPPARARADSGPGRSGGNGSSSSSNNNNNNNNTQNGDAGTLKSPTSTSTSRNTAAGSRPRTSEAPETSKRRPSSLGIFGWMRGATSSTTTPTQTHEKENNHSSNRGSTTSARNTPTPTGPKIIGATRVASAISSPTAFPYSTQAHNTSSKSVSYAVALARQVDINNTHKSYINGMQKHATAPVDLASTPETEGSGIERRGSRFSQRRGSWRPAV
ncbi:hypothetical protein RJZ56_004031 [Blastomyces dermatitidis]|uniref:Centrosomin N-terminal motif 1 domain-containing protein n=1 Tax=Ajellomyces dermatitidis (strain ATCC 18188 / CBS 674.68) TaxID=653446 RepID=F2THE0_AJEDA|nr:hypothetical protein BDDG_05597 [Blastomyces dermatitidis ATCC 18188]